VVGEPFRPTVAGVTTVTESGRGCCSQKLAPPPPYFPPQNFLAAAGAQRSAARRTPSRTPQFLRGLAAKSVLLFTGLLVAFLAGAPMDFAAVTAAIALLVLANRPPREALGAVDWSLLLFFTGLFVVVEGFVKADRYLLGRPMEAIGTRVGAASVAQLSAASAVGSNLFSNVPFVLIVSHRVRRMSEPRFVWLLLALTSTCAGNLTLFGSVANLIVAQGAQGESPLGFRDFLRAGAPVTLVTTAAGVLLLMALRLLNLA
jgi:Na+/H+ antiporter NhaD/arsenite permease-like protein